MKSVKSHLDVLLERRSPSHDDGEVDAAISAWEAILNEWEQDARSTANGVKHNELERAPVPTILELWTPPYTPDSDSPSASSGQQTPVPTINVEAEPASKLAQRVQKHFSSPSQLQSLVTLLSSPRSDEDIQSELADVLGFAGEGLSLLEDVLKPGIRAVLVEELGVTQSSQPIAHNKKQPYTPASQVIFTTNAPKPQGRKAREKPQKLDLGSLIGSREDIQRRLDAQLQAPRPRFADEEDQRSVGPQEVYPHVYTSAKAGTASLSYGGRLALPAGTIRSEHPLHDEVVVPPPVPVPTKRKERLIPVTELGPLAAGCFPSYRMLNRIQSIVQPIAMNTNENMLICAPTGAGKTDVALMSILRVINQNAVVDSKAHPSGFNIARNDFKVIYVAPMKALAAEITRKMGKRLAWLGIKVRELTGDMQMTRQEIAETQIIVTTPEKWDVVTRKPTGEGELASKVKLLIIDEVHLLNEDRGAVIETIVARTLRQVESSQSLIRIVGLSATLPNYIDVSDFLRVNRYEGLFYFDSSFRPIPLEQHFIGVRGKSRSMAQMRNMEQVVFDKVADLVREGHQVMVFVHARKETVGTAEKLREMALAEGVDEDFDTSAHPRFAKYRQEISTSRNKEMKQLFDAGFGIHHAGMLRSDRTMMERMFEDNCIKVLCCTSTLAWGVNLPAHAVVIKGTSVYDSGRGAFVDLSVLDVLQIFGRAGRPGYETSGVGYICTGQDKLDHYLDAILSQHPIESKFNSGMVDSLNAEISLGTIASVQDAISWIGYTYLFVRMQREPFAYGMDHDERKDDPQLGNKRNALVTSAAKELLSARMIQFDQIANTFAVTDLGRIAAKYYIRHQTVEVFNSKFKPRMSNADTLAMLSHATEFDQIKVRDNELPELTYLLGGDYVPCEVAGGAASAQGKVNILLQAHISKAPIEDFALVSDTAYVAQNAARIIRALLEIALSRNWAAVSLVLIDMSKAIERRMWPFDHPLFQYQHLKKDTLYNLRRWADNTTVAELRAMDPVELGKLVHLNESHGAALSAAAQQFPSLAVSYKLRPLSHDLLQVDVHLQRDFQWSEKHSGGSEPFYVWIQDQDEINILQWRSVLFRQSTTAIDLEFVIPIVEQVPELFQIVCVSDRWLGSDDIVDVPLQDLVMPASAASHTTLLDVPYLHISTIKDAELVAAYRPFIQTFNGIQSQAFWSVFNTHANILISAPVSSGKSVLAELAIWHAYHHEPTARVLVVVPRRHSAGEVAARLLQIAPPSRHISVKTLNSAQDMAAFASSVTTIGVVTPKVYHQAVHHGVKGAALVVFEDLHLLDPLYELTIASILSTSRPSRTRVVGISASLNEPLDVAGWLGVNSGGLFSFQPKDRDTPIKLTLQTFTIPHSATLLKNMIKPVYTWVKTAPSSAIVFVHSRAACRTVANDLITRSGTEMDLNGFLAVQRAELEPWLRRLNDRSLQETLLAGIGICHDGLSPSDMTLTLELFAGGLVRALVTPREICWTLPLRASVVVIMGAQYTGNERQVLNYTRQELVKMQSLAIRTMGDGAATGGHCIVMCQSEQRDSIARFLNDGLPLESCMASILKREAPSDAVNALTHMLGDRASPPVAMIHGRRQQVDLRRQDLIDIMGWTYLSWRAVSNPIYYDLHSDETAQQLSRLVDEWFDYREPAPVVKGKKKELPANPYATKKDEISVKAPLAEDQSADLRLAQRKAMEEGANIFDVDEEDEDVDVGDADGEPFET